MDQIIQDINRNDFGTGDKLKEVEKTELAQAVPTIIEATIATMQSADYLNYNFSLANDVCGALKEVLAPRQMKKHAESVFQLGEAIISMQVPKDVAESSGMKLGYIKSMNGVHFLGVLEMLMKEEGNVSKVIDQSMRLLEACEGEIDNVLYPVTTIVGKSPEDALNHMQVFVDIAFSNSYSWSTAAMALPPLVKKNPQPVLDRMEDILDKIEKVSTNLTSLHGTLQIICATAPEQCGELVEVLKDTMTAPMMGYHCLDLLNILAGSSTEMRDKMLDLFDTFQADNSFLTEASTIYMAPKLIATLSMANEESAKKGLALLASLSQGQSGAALLTMVAAFKGVSTDKSFDKSLIEPHLDTVKTWVSDPDGHTKEAAGGILAYYEGRDLEAVNTKANEAKETATDAKNVADEAKDAANDAVERVDIVEDQIDEVKARVDALEKYQSELDARLDEMKDFVADIVKKLPIPSKFDTSGILRKKLILTFECASKDDGCTPGEFCTETATINKWLKVAMSAVNVGVAVMEGDAIGGISAIYDTYNEINNEEGDNFDAFVNEPFLTSEEQDKLINQLRDAKFFSEFQYNGRTAGWQCARCYKRDVADKEKAKAEAAAAEDVDTAPSDEPTETPAEGGFEPETRSRGSSVTGEMKRKSSVLGRWKTVYAELDESSFTVRKSSNSKAAHHKFALSEITQIKEADYKSCGTNSALLVKAGSKSIVLDCPSGSERGKWISAFKEHGIEVAQ